MIMPLTCLFLVDPGESIDVYRKAFIEFLMIENFPLFHCQHCYIAKQNNFSKGKWTSTKTSHIVRTQHNTEGCGFALLQHSGGSMFPSPCRNYSRAGCFKRAASAIGLVFAGHSLNSELLWAFSSDSFATIVPLYITAVETGANLKLIWCGTVD